MKAAKKRLPPTGVERILRKKNPRIWKILKNELKPRQTRGYVWGEPVIITWPEDL